MTDPMVDSAGVHAPSSDMCCPSAVFERELRAARIAMRIGDDPRYIGTSEVLGAGSFGTVTLSYRPDGGGLWLRTAVKRISLRNEKSFSVALQIAQLVARELTFLRRVGDSPYVVPLFDPWFDCVKRVIALPMDAGECSLEQYALRCRYRFPPLVLLSICVQCARAVEHVHRHGVVHRDVKPDNFVVNIVRTAVGTGGGGGGGNVNKNSSNSNRESSGGSGLGDAQSVLVRMVDFGLACSVEEVVQESKHWVGTPHYMAPEAFPDRDEVATLSTACDVWSLGVMFFRLATGVFPYSETDRDVATDGPTAKASSRSGFHSCHPREYELSREGRAVLAVAASMMDVNALRRPNLRGVLQQLDRIGVIAVPAVSGISSRVQQLRLCRPDVVVAMYAVPQATEGEALPWQLRAGDTFLAEETEMDGCWDESCSTTPLLHRAGRGRTRMPSPQQRYSGVLLSHLQRQRGGELPPQSDVWLRVVYPRKGYCRGFVEGQHVMHVVTRPGREEACKRCSPLRPLLRHVEFSQGADFAHSSRSSRRSPSTAPFYVDPPLATPLARDGRCLACVPRQKSPPPLCGPHGCRPSEQLQGSIR
ncbi:hypothetical protein JKF63_06002 [Porcisia hertigi]|uniref:non-specific serine/threonine protein kinase n=1 Tax=Porcisia hertigi TaxID=2761500 RepID=A0A836IBR2_9TRYP|nr:hypothetical protein JKF63_06002 [Porcisia hertigi]